MGSYPDTDIDPQIYYGAQLQRKQSKAKQNPRLKYFIYDLKIPFRKTNSMEVYFSLRESPREKIRTRASFTKMLANYTSEESLIT